VGAVKALKNGDKLVFNTEPKTMATVVGCPNLLGDKYGLLFAPHGTVEDAEVKGITPKQLSDAVVDGLVILPTGVEIESPKPKKKKKAKAKKPASIVPPWGQP